ncbi:MAG: hypothetical protein HeimC2_05640 [Candidatus Heimdallarchaeota archaeon LC_2]|nr:MAG: hypothetical protein HeimC2_05640 [Candidatus Heimdallarchaeota archaeon LC_2]
MQSVISTKSYLAPNSRLRILPIIFDLLLIVDIFVSTYILLFSPERTLFSGVWLLLAYQLFFFPFFILIAYYNTRSVSFKSIISTDKDIESKKKHPLAYTILNRKTEIVAPPFEKRLSLLRTLIYFGFALDLLVAINFLILSALINDGGGDGSIAGYSILFDQVYILPPIFVMIFYYLHLRGQRISIKESNIEILQGTERTSATRKTFFASIKLRKKLKLIVTVSFILLLLFFAVFAYAKQAEDNNINSLDLDEIGSYENLEIHGMYDTGDQIDIIAYGLLWQGTSLSYHILRYSIDADNNKILSLKKLSNIPVGFRSIIDSVITDNEMYMLLLDNKEWNYLIYKYTFETEEMELLYTWELGIDGRDFGGRMGLEYQLTFGQFEYIISPYEHGVHLIQTQIPYFFRPIWANIISIDSIGTTTVALNMTILDVISYNDKTYFLHIGQSNFDNFLLTSYNGVGANFSTSSFTTEVLNSKFTENIHGVPTPNSATLFMIEDTLYYRSTQNLFDINKMESSDEQPNIENQNYDFYNRGLRGVANQDNLIYFSSETQIQYTSLVDLEESEVAKADNSHYSSSVFSNILISDDILVTASDNGRIFTWEIDPELIIQDKEAFSELILIGIILYLSASSIYFIVRRKI